MWESEFGGGDLRGAWWCKRGLPLTKERATGILTLIISPPPCSETTEREASEIERGQPLALARRGAPRGRDTVAGGALKRKP